MTARQREIGMRGFVVMVGRDIGTVVMPEADVKIFLVASAEERARRRYAEKIERQEPAAYAEILQAVRERDAVDSTRDIAPLKAAEDAWIIDSDNLTADQVLSLVITRIEANP
jgi:cytidylate kinase